ncbi:MAG: hypothetical protein JWM82_3604 [Myxococcales bacterium]|nr:hypothetical protein [Myxococcales bacterium]
MGLPVGVRIGAEETSVLAELLDVSETGARFQAEGDDVGLAQRAGFAFVLPERGLCHAEGEVVRVDGAGMFVLALDDRSEEFVGFIHRLEGAA